MENDRELLELAAKAAGMRVRQWIGSLVRVDNDGLDAGAWNPLADDGDALRLAVRLGIQIDPRDPETRAFGPVGDRIDEYHKPDAFFATRRAIVRAAAEIGRAME